MPQSKQNADLFYSALGRFLGGNTVAIRSFTVLLPYCYRIAREEEGKQIVQ